MTAQNTSQSAPVLDRAVDAARSEHPDPEVVRLAADRVWARLAAEAAVPGATRRGAAADDLPISGCDGYQALIPAYLAGELAPARHLLVEDHSRECVACRRALIAARSGRPVHAPAPVVSARRDGGSRRLWLPLAAAVLLMVGFAGWWLTDGLFAGTVAQVAAVDGTLMALDVDQAPGGVGTAAVGLAILAGQPVRTGRGSSAVVRLGDGSLVELAERTQISVRERRRGTTVAVERGSIIVEAAPQREKHLYVATDEALVSVTGTIFAVQHGVRGSRVSVVEGEVRVKQAGTETVLHPGQQVTSRSSLTAMPVAHEIAWSRNVDRYLAMLSEVADLRDELARRVGPGELRYGGDLMPLVPADSAVYVALPNVSATVAEGWAVFRERLAESPNLAAWWTEHGAEGREPIDQMVERLRVFGSHLGGEVVIVLGGIGADDTDPVLLAEVDDAAALRAFVEQELAGLESGGDGHGLLVVDDPAAAGEGDLVLWITDGLLAASTDRSRLLQVAADRAAGDSGFAATELGQAVTRAYADGTEYLFAVELGEGGFLAEAPAEEEELAASGLGDVERLLIERWDEGERGVMSAELTFAQARRGVASWLAAPAPMGALDFVSAEAHLAAAFVVKQPAAMLDDVLALSGATQGGAGEGGLADFERELGLSLRDDVAAPLGGEVVLALDGPFLPQPAWKAVVEVYDPARLQHTLETVVARVNTERSRRGEAPLVLAATESGGRTFHRLASPGGYTLHYLYADGYLVAAPSRALLERTLQQRAAGSRLTASPRFRELLPRDARADFSALLFQDLGPVLAPLGNGLSQLGGSELSEEQRRQLTEVMARTEPTVAFAYGDEDRILVGGTGPGGPFGFGFQALTGIGGLSALGEVLGHVAEQSVEAEAAGPVS
ncbi:MAG TPA: FecR domain-containing protein [Thermoanaerobaculia bacterium]|nr:FecR domain-containing protein [Thermoanaerobaculia bacterium]